MVSTIVFGPTGNIASVAARTAAEHGAQVALAMRDPSKDIPGLSKETEKAGKFTRIQADLTKPETVAEAIKTSGAKRAFIYLAHGSQDHMKATLEAMKGAGIDFVVFLSSFTIGIGGDRPLRDIPPADIIPYLHAQVEASLDDVFGDENYVAVRPGAFVTNLVRDIGGIKAGEVPIFGPHFPQDLITPGDMGRVSGTILVKGANNGQKKVFLYGPQVISHREAIGEIGKVLGKDIKIKDLNVEEGREHFAQLGFPQVIIDYFVRMLEMAAAERNRFPHYEEGVKNVKEYTGQSSTSFQDWLKENKGLFEA